MSYLKEVSKQERISLIISENINNKIKYLCSKIPNLEWSGILLYSIQEGSIKEPEKLVLKAEDLIPLDKGTSANTELDFTKESVQKAFVSYIMKNPHLGDLKWGGVHSHHSMGK